MAQGDAVDKWGAWLLHRRDGDDAEQHAKDMEYLAPIRERVLNNARIVPEDTVLDVGGRGRSTPSTGSIDVDMRR
jgi:hypothetical protein